MAHVGLGLVGYYQFIRGYPLGPELKERLESVEWAGHQVEIKEMNWGPVAIVQDFQASGVSALCWLRQWRGAVRPGPSPAASGLAANSV